MHRGAANNPLGSRVLRDVAVKDLAAAVFDHEEAVQRSEGHSRYGEEVESGDRLAVIAEKGEPPLVGIATAMDSSHIASHAAFGDAKAEFLKFAVDLGRAPIGVLVRQSVDQSASLGSDLRPGTARTRPPTPVETKAGAVPGDDGLRLYDHKDVRPARPEAAEGSPEEAVLELQSRPRLLACEHGNLLP